DYYEQYFASQKFGTSPESQKYQQLCQTQLTRIHNEIDSGLREEKQDRSDQETKVGRKKALRRQNVSIGIAIVFGLIGAAEVIYSIVLSKFPHANTGTA